MTQRTVAILLPADRPPSASRDWFWTKVGPAISAVLLLVPMHVR